MVHPKVWHDVPYKEVREAVSATDPSQDAGSDGQTKIGQENQVLVLPLVQGAAGQKVVDAAVAILLADTLTLRLLGVVVVTGDVGEQIHWPASDLLGKEVDRSGNRSLLHELVHFVQQESKTACLLVASSWHEDHVALHVTGSLVVLAVADLPAEVWNQKSRVAEPADGIVQSLTWREGLVSTLVCEHPEAGPKQSLDEGVSSPQSGSKRI